MKKGKITRLFSLITVTTMVATCMPLSAYAKNTNQKSFANAQLSIVTDKTSTLAKGVTQDLYTVYDKDGNQVKMFAATMDMSVDSVKLYTSYKGMDNNTYGMSKLTEQVSAFTQKAEAGDSYYQGTVVAGINASYYNMINGKPSGVFVMNGNDVTGNDKSAYFAVMNDGSVKIGRAEDYATDKGNIKEALGIYKMLVYDGEIVLSDSDQKSTQKYPRQTIGITADNKVIILTADGNQAPESVGLTLMEQAQVMLDLGCVWAGHLDGGGSATYGSKAEGSDDFAIVNKPSDGSERSISSGFLVVSTEAVSNSFDHVSMSVADEYVTSGTSTEINVSGVSASGNAADIPEDITYSAEHGTVQDGIYTAGNETGTDTITAYYNGQAVGSVSVNVVIPDKIAFSGDTITVPFGKTVDLELKATYGVNNVKIKDSDIDFSLAESAIGTISGMQFTAGDGTVTESMVTATIVGTDISDSAKIVLGKGSEVAVDFEDGTTNGFGLTYKNYNYYLPNSKVSVATAENGKVHNGKYSLALNIDYSNSLESGYQMIALYQNGKDYVGLGAKSVGMWMYIPDEYVGLWGRWVISPISGVSDDGNINYRDDSITGGNMDGKKGTTGVVSTFNESGWHYVSLDLSKYQGASLRDGYYLFQFYISDRDGATYNYYFKNQHNVNGNYTIYVDDITFDYSDAVEDREAPVFGDMTYATTNMSDAAVLKDGADINSAKVDFSASVTDDMSKKNYTGIDVNSAKAFVDGNEVDATYNNGIISMKQSATFTNGQHKVKFTISDKQGNSSSIIRTINISQSTEASVQLIAHDPSADRVLLDSLNYYDVVAENVENIKKVSLTIDLDNMSKWELDHMNVAKGFVADYSIQEDENIATINIERNGDVDQTGKGVLASLPVRAWTLHNENKVNPKSNKEWTLAQFRAGNEFWPIAIDLQVDQGLVTFMDSTTETFTGKEILVWTEMWANYSNMVSTTEGKAYYNSWNGGHTHTTSLIEKAATCLEDGYTGRTFCKECNSVVDWGTTVPATGHNYEFVDGLLRCVNTDCDSLFTGIWKDGKEYKDGQLVAASDGWIGNCYYMNGVKITGIHKVSDKDNTGEFYYEFGEDGTCVGKYTGLLQIDQQWYYSKVGSLVGGWVQINDKWHYFKSYTKSAATGEYKVGSVTYQFDEQGATEGAWYHSNEGTRYYYGPSYYVARNPGYMTLIQINGKTYNFDENGYLTYGIQALRDSTSYKKYLYEFAEDGSLAQQFTDEGIYNDSKGDSYYINSDGYIAMNAGVIKINDDYYYVVSSGKLKKDGNQTVSAEMSNGLIEAGTYYFSADGKMAIPEKGFTGIEKADNGNYYYKINGVIPKNKGLIKIGDAYYFICYSGKLKANGNQTITAKNANGLVEPGVYYFNTDGKMDLPVSGYTGIEKAENGNYYYKVNGAIQKNKGLIKVDGDYYYICYSGKLKTNGYQTVTETSANGLYKAGVYYFGADGKMAVPKIEKGADGNYYCTINGAVQKNKGLIQIGDAYYFICYSGKVKTNGNQTITEKSANGLVEPGIYYFGYDGIMVVK